MLLLSACGLAEYCAAHPWHVAGLALWGRSGMYGESSSDKVQQQRQQQGKEGQARDGGQAGVAGEVVGLGHEGQGQGSNGARLHSGPGRQGDLRQRQRGQVQPVDGVGDVLSPEGAAGSAANGGRAGYDGTAGPAGTPGGDGSGGGSGSSGAGGSAGGAERGGSALTGFLSPDLAVMVYPWAFSLAVCVSVMHVQVSTRLLLSSCPVLYWYMAHVWGGAGAGGRSTIRDGGAGRRRSAGQGVGAGRDKHDGNGSYEEHGALEGSSGGGGFKARGVGARGGGWLGAALWRWCLVYGWVGAVLFVNFMPWT